MAKETATKLCPMCNEVNRIELGQTEVICSRCGYKILRGTSK